MRRASRRSSRRRPEAQPSAAAEAPVDDVDRHAGPDVVGAIDELSNERDRLAQAVQAFEDGVVVVDEHGAPVVRNAAGERYHGARHADAIAEQSIGDLLAAALRGEQGEQELRLFGPPRKVLLVRAVPLRSDGRIVGAVAVIRDVSEARRIAEMRRDFVANVSHELRTPIGALGLLAETIATGADPAVVQQLAERMVRESERLERIVDDLLDLSLIEAQEASSRERIPVEALVADAVERVRGAADVAAIPLLVGEPTGELEIECDRRQVVSALSNLLDNAVKYSEPGQPVEVAARTESGRVAIVVRDHGIGIPSRDLERIFERFYRVDRARSRQTGGTGLGLSIVRHVAHSHGGEVAVESREGEGSTFTLWFPVTAGDAADGRPPEDGEDQASPSS